jgi:DNA-binding HxlR family transcriptional regulator
MDNKVLLTLAQRERKVGGRAGTKALALLSDPCCVAVVRELSAGPQPLAALCRSIGSPPPTTLRERLRTLTKFGVLERRRLESFPRPVTVDLTGPGDDLLALMEISQSWLASSPAGPLVLGTASAEHALKALTGSWATNMVRALASRPLSLTELDRALGGLDYPSIQRRLTAMRRVGQVRALPDRGRSTPYAVTAWLRRAAVPLVAAIRWECQHLQGRASPMTNRDAEAAFLLAMPMVRLPAELKGSCRLTATIPGADEPATAGVLIRVGEGRVLSCVPSVGGEPDAWAAGSLPAWLEAMADSNSARLELGGEVSLVRQILEALQGSVAKEIQSARRGFDLAARSATS